MSLTAVEVSEESGSESDGDYKEVVAPRLPTPTHQGILRSVHVEVLLIDHHLHNHSIHTTKTKLPPPPPLTSENLLRGISLIIFWRVMDHNAPLDPVIGAL